MFEKQYVVLIDCQNEDFVAIFPDFPGLKCEAASIFSLIDGSREAIRLYSAILKKNGKAIPPPLPKEEILHYHPNSAYFCVKSL